MPKQPGLGRSNRRVLARFGRPAAFLVAVLAAGTVLIAGAGFVQGQQPNGDVGVESGFALREVLLIAAEKAVERCSASDGFFGNPEIRIPLPAGLQTGEETLRRFGLGPRIDDLVLPMNRAAERTAGQALPSLMRAIREIDLGDAPALLRAEGSAATTAFQTAAEQRLIEDLTPLVAESLEQTGGTAAYQSLVEAGGSLVSMAGVTEGDLVPHVAGRTVQGLLQLMAAHEIVIRQEPSARITPLLRKVFGSLPAATIPDTAGTPMDVPDPAAEQSAAEQPAGVHDERRQALTEALLVASLRAISRASEEDGYWGNEVIRIPLPKKLQRAGDRLRDLGLGKPVDELELSINRAAEQAAAEAVPIISDAVKATTFEDVVAILTGGETAATDALRAKTEEKLSEVFLPVIDAKMSSTGVTRHYDKLLKQAGPVLMLLGLDAEADLPAYVTDKALEGLFTLLAEEEAKIRKDPVARTTDLLRRIFGSLGS